MGFNFQHSIFGPLIAGIGVFFFIYILSPLCPRLKLMDEPNHRKLHKFPVPAIGGISIFLSIAIIVALAGVSSTILWPIIAASILILTGALDDACGLGVRSRLYVQILSAALMIFGHGIWVQSLQLGWTVTEQIMPALSIPFTILAVIGLINAINMADGIDGLAAGHVLIGTLCLCISLYAQHGFVYQLDWLTTFFAAVCTFWCINLSMTPLKQVYLGDASSVSY